ncbi:MAG: hypothetical protein ACR2HV_06775 [Acidimicrobiales bacterium]
MFFILVLGLVVGVIVLGLVSLGLLGGDKPKSPSRSSAVGTRPVLALGGLLGLVVVFGGATLLLLGAPGERPDGGGEGPPDQAPVTEPSPVTTLGNSQGRPAPRALPVVVMRAAVADRFAEDTVVEMLQPGSVVELRPSGFGAFETGVIEQCINERGRITGCTAPFPVQFGENGGAEFQYQLREASPLDLCRVGRPTCLLRVTGQESGRTGVSRAVYLDAAPPGTVDVEPRNALRDGQMVEVSVAGFPPDAVVTAMLCAPPWGYDARRCGVPGQTATFRVDERGSGRTALPVRPGRVGADGVLCSVRGNCAVSVVSIEGYVAAPVIPIRFARGPGAGYTPWRLAGGLATALGLGVIAIGIARRTDWSKPTEADTPDLDDADLQVDATLDDVFVGTH